jgi:hypothetical protein
MTPRLFSSEVVLSGEPVANTNNENAAFQVRPDEVELIRRDYAANDGWETFLAYEDPRQDILVGLLRLRQLSSVPEERQAGLTGARTCCARACMHHGIVPCQPPRLAGLCPGKRPSCILRSSAGCSDAREMHVHFTDT